MFCANIVGTNRRIICIRYLAIKYLVLYFILISQWIVCDKISSNCLNRETCSECIQNDCVWCSDIRRPTEHPFTRCKDPSDANSLWCPLENRINPRPELNVVQNISIHKVNRFGDFGQMQPQHIQLTLRRGQEYTFEFHYTHAKDYPVDLYYLMDLSASMADDKEKVSTLGYKLADVMKNITGNFRLGFGSFVDKTDLPFVSIVPSKLAKPCTLSNGQNCAPPYSFLNHMSLTENTHQFTTELQKARVSGNLDVSEGGFDGLLQVMVCQKQIGWRSRARHLVVFSTDAGFHYAGDGKLAGLVEPHDGECHLNSKGEYTKSLNFDYPSIAQINRAAIENNINIIFAVVKNQASLYNNLKKMIYGSQLGILSQDSSNVVELVRGLYDKLVDTIIMTDNSTEDIEIKYFSSCLTNAPERETKVCDGLRVGSVVKFTAKIRALSCDGPKSRTIRISPQAINESLTVDINIICECSCESLGNYGYSANSDKCNHAGDLKCGVCDCNNESFGRFCECNNANETIAANDTTSGCVPMHSGSQILCYNHGTCTCNKCECFKRQNPEEEYYGRYCECDNFSCSRHKGVLCSGRGTCDCGTCTCQPGWRGPACECAQTNLTCMQNPSKGTLCSGRGWCDCGTCMCHTEPFKYSGRYCEECSNCPGQRCEEFKDCMECLVFKTGKFNEHDCRTNCSTLKVDLVDRILTEDKQVDMIELDGEDSEWKICRVPDDFGCVIVFKYKYEIEKQLEIIFAQKTKECPLRVEVLDVLMGISGTIVLIGLMSILFWKILTEVHDRREFARFEIERKNPQWNDNENPLYKQATSTFNNPMYKMPE